MGSKHSLNLIFFDVLRQNIRCSDRLAGKSTLEISPQKRRRAVLYLNQFRGFGQALSGNNSVSFWAIGSALRSAADEKGKTSVTVVSCESSRLDGARTYDNNLHMNQPAANLNLDEQRWVIRQANIEDHSVIVSYNLALAEETEGKTLARAALQAGVQKGLSVQTCADISLLNETDKWSRKRW